MRVVKVFFGLSLVATSLSAIAGGCGSSVSTVTGGSGGSGASGGTGGAQVTTVTASSSSSSSSTTTTSSSTSASSTGGGDSCMQACSHIETCVGINLCNMGFNLDCTNPQYQCTADCINGLDCANLNIQTGQACLAQCAPPSDGGLVDGGDPCMNACAHVQQCFGIDLCAQLGMQLDCSTPTNVCIANCVSNTTCGMLSQQTLQMCQAQCQTTMVDGGGASDAGGGGFMQCQSCALQGCGQQATACATNTTCMSWLNCVSQCTTPACVNTCDMMFAGAKNLYDPLYTCTCTNCSSQCAALDPCGHMP